MRSIHFLIFIPILLIACATTDLSKTFDEIAIEHYAMVHGSASELEWYELIAEFEKIIETDPTHEIADDAQWAIASCWMWLAERQGTVAFQRAAKNFRHLIDHYPNSIYLPQSHYFLGKCSEKLGDQNEAISQFQIVVEQFSDQPIAINAQNELDKFSSENSEANQPTEVSEKKPIEIADSEKPISNESEKSEIEITELDEPITEEIPSSKVVSDPSLVQQLQLGVRRIVIDPGHGAKDPGGVSKFGKEKSIVLRVAKKLKSELIDRGYEPILTRETDDFIHLKDRSQFANENAADLFVSIHANSAASENANGIETYYLALASDESAAQTASRENAGSGSTIHILDQVVKNILQNSKSNESERLARCVQESLISRTNATDRGVRHAPFVVLIGTKVPAILIELGFLTNADESQKLIHPDHQNELAIAIADGIEKYIANATIE